MLRAEEKREGPPSCASPALDPLLRDLSEKKESFRKGVVSLAAELKDARARLALKEESFAREILSRKAVEKKAKSMEAEICKLQCSLEERDKELQASTSTLEQYLRSLDDIRLQFSITQANVESSTRSVESAEAQCLSLVNELNEKNSLLKAHEDRVNVLGGQVDLLHKSLKVRDDSQKQLKDEVLRIEKDIMLAVAKAGYKRDYEVRKILEEVSRKDYENINKILFAKDEEISQLRHEIKFLSAHWKRKSKDLESQLEKHRRADQELKKRVLKLEFCLQEARSQSRKLQRMGERRDMALQELRDQLALKESNQDKSMEKQKIWENAIFKFVTSMSMLALVVFARR